jgi:hypothetical protein
MWKGTLCNTLMSEHLEGHIGHGAMQDSCILAPTELPTELQHVQVLPQAHAACIRIQGILRGLLINSLHCSAGGHARTPHVSMHAEGFAFPLPPSAW